MDIYDDYDEYQEHDECHEYDDNELMLKEMQDCLDSDDELPTSYTEKPELPAYLDHDRFDKIEDLIEFPWLNTLPVIHPQTQDQEDCADASIETASETHENKITHTTLPLTTVKETLEKKCILKEWINNILSNHTAQQTNKTKSELLKIPLTTHGRHAQKKDTSSNFLSTTGTRTLLKRGILKKGDIICMKNFAAQTTDESALLWFINFLQKKDLQSEYKFLKSCLVPNQIIDDNCGQIYSQRISNRSNIKFELVVI